MTSSATELMNVGNEKTLLAGFNKMELLLFTLGGREVFGINVFKVREVCETPPITKMPNMPRGVEGIISLRGAVIPVVALAPFVGLEHDGGGAKLIITEFSGHTQAFLVHDVDRIIRVDWDHVRQPQAMLVGSASLVSAITELPDGKLVSILDVEQVIADTLGEEQIPHLEPLESRPGTAVFFADDSALARRKIAQVLEKLCLTNQHAQNGREAWDKLQQLALAAEQDGVQLAERLGMVLADAEMPEMDGYVLTRHIKSDRRFDGIPVVMHSSLSSVANRKMGQQVGVDAYVAKFDATVLASTIAGMLKH
jgi:two-component system, chemotaxis family, chemotaxis protein CheV